MRMFLAFVTIGVFFFSSAAYCFDFHQYKQGDLDELLQLPKPVKGVKVVPPRKLRFRVVLEKYAEVCNAGFLKKAMLMAGAAKGGVARVSISKCITVSSEKGAKASLFIQDKVAAYLPREIKPGQQIEIFCDFLYVGIKGPGLLVNEFQKVEEAR